MHVNTEKIEPLKWKTKSIWLLEFICSFNKPLFGTLDVAYAR